MLGQYKTHRRCSERGIEHGDMLTVALLGDGRIRIRVPSGDTTDTTQSFVSAIATRTTAR